MLKVLVTDDRHGFYHVERDILARAGADLEVLPEGSAEELLPRLLKADALLANQLLLGRELISGLERCRIISRYGCGYDNVDVEAATERGIWVARVPDYCYPEVAEHALALLLAAVRRVPAIHSRVAQGGWNLHSSFGMSRVRGKVLGILGYGGTGRSFHQVASGLGFSRVLVCDHRLATGQELADDSTEIVDFKQLLQESDILSLHIPYRQSNHHLINTQSLALMKEGAVLVNTSRGAVVDTMALVQALRSGRLDAAGLDVFEHEPPGALPFLEDCPNLVLSDHCAYYSEDSILELKRKAAENIARVFNGQKPLYPVNQLQHKTVSGPV